MPILVTGASGALGAHLAKRLLNEGHEVVSILHDERPFSTARLVGVHDKITWVRGDLLNERLCKRVIADYGVDYIYHLAALPIVQVATRTATPIFENNLMATINLLEAVKENAWAGKAIHFIYQSTDKVYGDVAGRPYTEDMPLNGLGVYDASKAMADLAVRTYAKAFIPSAIISRACNLIMPGDLNFGRIFPRTIIPAMRGEAPHIYRTSYLREFMFVDDAVEGLIQLAHRLAEKPELNGQAFNFGSGIQRTLDQVIATILGHFPGIEPHYIDPPKLTRIEIPYQKLDCTKIQAELGWTAKTSFEDGVAKLVAWWRERWDWLPLPIRMASIKTWHG